MFFARPALLPALAMAYLAGAAAAAPLAPPDLVVRPGAPVPVFDNRVTETTDLPTWELQQARRRMLADEPVAWNEMRALADNGDGLAAFRFAQRIEAEDKPALLPDAAFYYATAAYTNRSYAVGPLVRILGQRDLEFSPRRLEHMENALRAMAVAGDAKAKEALTRFYATGHPFGRQPERALEFRLDLAEAGDAEAAMALVLDVLSGNSPVLLEEEQVGRLLDVVVASDDLGLRTTGENLRRMIETKAAPAIPAAASEAPETPAAVAMAETDWALVRPVARPVPQEATP